MNIILFGATGMVGQGALRECLLAPDVERVLAVGRGATGQAHEKLREIVRDDLFDLSAVEGELAGYDACFFCLGASSAGMSEAAYRRVTYDLTMAVAGALAKQNPGMTFVFVSGAGTDGSEKGGIMWARVKGEAENAVARLPFKATYAFRPAFIQPLHGIKSKTKLYRAAYVATVPLFPALKALFPKYVTTTEEVGRAMLEVARRGAPKRVLENADISALAREAAGRVAAGGGLVGSKGDRTCRAPPPGRGPARSRANGSCSSPCGPSTPTKWPPCSTTSRCTRSSAARRSRANGCAPATSGRPPGNRPTAPRVGSTGSRAGETPARRSARCRRRSPSGAARWSPRWRG